MQSIFSNFGLAVMGILKYAEQHGRTVYLRKSGSDNYPQYCYTFDVINPDHDSIVCMQQWVMGPVADRKTGVVKNKNIGKFYCKNDHYESAKRVRSSTIGW